MRGSDEGARIRLNWVVEVDSEVKSEPRFFLQTGTLKQILAGLGG